MTAGCGVKQQRLSDSEIARSNASAIGALPEPTGGMILSVNNEAIGAGDIVERLMSVSKNAPLTDYESYRAEVMPYVREYVTEKISDILIYRRAKNSMPEGALDEDGMVDKAVDKEIRRLLADANAGYSDIQAKLAENGFDWTTYRKNKKRSLMIQSYFGLEIKDQKEFSYAELKSFYNEHITDFETESDYAFTLVHIQPETENAAALAEEARQALIAGEDAAEVVKKYSEGIKAASGGLWKTADPSSFAAPYDVLADEIKATEQGAVSNVVSSGGNYFVFKLDKKQVGGGMPFEQAQSDIEKYLRLKYRTDKMQEIMTELFEKARIGEANVFIEYCIRQAWERSNGK
jgi:parvulin-like peptidyl-prolyl isomerase